MKVIALRQLPVATKPGSSVYKPVAAGRVEMSTAGAPAEPRTMGSWMRTSSPVFSSLALTVTWVAARSEMRRVVIFAAVLQLTDAFQLRKRWRYVDSDAERSVC